MTATRTILAGLAVMAACGGGPNPESRRRAHAIWNERCIACHGPTGMGDGPNARNLAVPPRRLNDPFWQRTITDEEIARVIVEGGAANGKSTLMAANADLRDQPDVVRALVGIVRDL